MAAEVTQIKEGVLRAHRYLADTREKLAHIQECARSAREFIQSLSTHPGLRSIGPMTNGTEECQASARKLGEFVEELKKAMMAPAAWTQEGAGTALMRELQLVQLITGLIAVDKFASEVSGSISDSIEWIGRVCMVVNRL